MASSKFDSLVSLLKSWITIIIPTFQGEDTEANFRLLHLGNDKYPSHYDIANNDINNFKNEELKNTFKSLSSILNYDALPSWIKNYKEGHHVDREINEIVIHDTKYIVPSRETLREMIHGFLTFHNFLKKNNIEKNEIIQFVIFLERCLALSE